MKIFTGICTSQLEWGEVFQHGKLTVSENTVNITARLRGEQIRDVDLKSWEVGSNSPLGIRVQPQGNSGAKDECLSQSQCKTHSQSRRSRFWGAGLHIFKDCCLLQRGVLHLTGGALVCQPSLRPALPSSAVTFWTLWCSCFQMYFLIIFPRDESLLSLHFRLCCKLFFHCVILCKCWCVTELSQEQIGKIIVSDGDFTSCNFQSLAQILELDRNTALNHRKALIFESV